MRKVAFICVHNSCRSQMAEALAKAYGGKYLEVYSAGTEVVPKINSNAIEVIEKLFSIDMSNQKSKLLNQIPDVDIVITMGCNVSCPNIPCKHTEDWGIKDPSGREMEVFEKTAFEIKEKVIDLIERVKNMKL